MKQKKSTVTLTQINTDVMLEVDIAIDRNSIISLPASVLFVNNSGCEVGIVYVLDANEQTDMTKYPDEYAYVPLASSRSSSELPHCRYVRVIKLSGTATGSIDIYTVGYREKI